MHKESVSAPFEETNAPKVYRDNNEKSLAYKITVYSQSQKKIMIKSKIATKKQIIINGCPSSDYAFRLRKIKTKKNIILYYLIESNRGKNTLSYHANVSWKKLYDQTLDYIISYATNNPEIKLILKGKIGEHTKSDFSSLSTNCIEGGLVKLFKDSTVVIFLIICCL